MVTSRGTSVTRPPSASMDPEGRSSGPGNQACPNRQVDAREAGLCWPPTCTSRRLEMGGLDRAGRSRRGGRSYRAAYRAADQLRVDAAPAAAAPKGSRRAPLASIFAKLREGRAAILGRFREQGGDGLGAASSSRTSIRPSHLGVQHHLSKGRADDQVAFVCRCEGRASSSMRVRYCM